MFDKHVVTICVLALLIFIIWNYETPVVEGAAFNFNKYIKKAGKTLNKVGTTVINTIDNKKPAATAAATATAATAATATLEPPTLEPPSTGADSVETNKTVPVTDSIKIAATGPEQNEIQAYLDKLKTYSTDAIKMSDTINESAINYSKAYDEATNSLTNLKTMAETAASKAATTFSEIQKKADAISKNADAIQAQVNSNNIIKNEITNIQKNVSGYAIDASNSAMSAKKSVLDAQTSAEGAKNALASILPTAANNTVTAATRVEGFSGFNNSVLEGYTVYSNPNSAIMTGSAAGQNSFDLEQKLINNLTIFNIKYYAYLGLNASPEKDAALAELNTAQTNLKNSIAALQSYITAANSSSNPPKITQAVFDASHNAIKTTASQINALRSDLDMKMQELIKAKEGVPMDYTIERDAAAYSTILWTALATSMIYLIFVKIE